MRAIAHLERERGGRLLDAGIAAGLGCLFGAMSAIAGGRLRTSLTGAVHWALVTHAGARRVAIEPCDPAVQDRVVRPSEIEQVYRPVGRPGDASGRRLRPSPRQLRLDDPSR